MHTQYQLHLLLSDQLLMLLLCLLLLAVIYIIRHPHLRSKWGEVFKRPQGMMAGVVLLFFILIGCIDSIHYNATTYNQSGQVSQLTLKSGLDRLLGQIGTETERTYSAPLALYAFSKSNFKDHYGHTIRGYARLDYAGHHNWNASTSVDIGLRILCALGLVILVMVVLTACSLCLYCVIRKKTVTFSKESPYF